MLKSSIVIIVILASIVASIAVSAGCMPVPEHGVLIRGLTPEDGKCKFEVYDCSTKQTRVASTTYLTIAMLMKHFKERNFWNVGSSPFDNVEQIERIARQEYDSTKPCDRLIEMVALPLSLGCLPAFKYNDSAEIDLLEKSLDSENRFSDLQARIALRVKKLSGGLRLVTTSDERKFNLGVRGGRYLELTDFKKVSYQVSVLSIAVKRVPVRSRRIIVTQLKPYFMADDMIISVNKDYPFPATYVAPDGPPEPVGDWARPKIEAPWDPKPKDVK